MVKEASGEEAQTWWVQLLQLHKLYDNLFSQISFTKYYIFEI